MSKSLNNHMDYLLSKAIVLLSEYQEDILLEWNSVKGNLKENGTKYVNACEYIVEHLSTSMQSIKHGGEVNKLFRRLQEESMSRFAFISEPEMIIYILNLLENATHNILKSHITYSSHLHPSVHYFFSKIHEVLVYQNDDTYSLDSLCNRIVNQADLQVKSIIRVEEDPNLFRIRKVYGSCPVKLAERYTAWYDLVQELGGYNSTLPIPFGNELLIIEGENENVHSSLTLLFSTLNQYDKLYSNQWKDAVILFNEWIIRSQTLEQSLENICFGFGEFLPFERCALFRFSNMESTAVGLYAHHLNQEQIREIRERIIDIPALKESLSKLEPVGEEMRNFQPLYIDDASNGFPKKFVEQFQLGSLIIVPVYVPEEGKMIGGVILDQGPGKFFPKDRSLYSALMKFGQSAGELMLKFVKPEADQLNHTSFTSINFSPREIEVLKLLADGASTTEAAVKLYLSEYTVRDYISSIMRRLQAKNRTEAAVKAIRLGIID